MKMKKIILLLIALVISSLVIAEEQPELLNHQFYGEVTWAKDSPVPSTLTAMLGDGIFTAEIRSSPCLEDPCKGRYGYDPDNILRVQGESGAILFSIDGVEAGEHPYQEDTVTKLDFDLRPEEEEEEPSDGGGFTEEQEVVNETFQEPSLPPPAPEVIEPVKKPQQIKPAPKEIPSFQIPSAPVKEVEKKEGLNPYLIGGIVLIVAAIAVVTFLIIKKRREAEEF